MLDETFLKNIQEGDLISLVGRSPLVPFNLFWVKKSGKRVLLKSTGEFSSRSDLEKWINKNLNLESESHLNENWIKEGTEKLTAYQSLHEENFCDPLKLQAWTMDWVSWIHTYLWEKGKELNRLDICFLIGVFFYDLTEKEEELFLNYPIEVQKKNYLMASFGVILATLVGYNEKDFLCNYFKTLLFWDAPFASNMWSESEANFLKQEWNEPGLGFTLSTDTKDQITKLFEEELPNIKELLSENLKYKGLLKYLNWSFESLNGEGRPFGFRAAELSDLDVLTIFLAHRFSYEEEISITPEQGVLNGLFDVSAHFKKNNLSTRLENIVKTTFSKALELKGGFLEIVGL